MRLLLLLLLLLLTFQSWGDSNVGPVVVWFNKKEEKDSKKCGGTTRVGHWHVVAKCKCLADNSNENFLVIVNFLRVIGQLQPFHFVIHVNVEKDGGFTVFLGFQNL